MFLLFKHQCSMERLQSKLSNSKSNLCIDGKIQTVGSFSLKTYCVYVCVHTFVCVCVYLHDVNVCTYPKICIWRSEDIQEWNLGCCACPASTFYILSHLLTYTVVASSNYHSKVLASLCVVVTNLNMCSFPKNLCKGFCI